MFGCLEVEDGGDVVRKERPVGVYIDLLPPPPCAFSNGGNLSCERT
jgi:hypothetical protein